MSKISPLHSKTERLAFSLEQWLRLDTESTGRKNLFSPLSRLLNIHRTATRTMQHVQSVFLDHPPLNRPYIIGVSGGVSAGKSKFANTLCSTLGKNCADLDVQRISTDSFLYPLKTLEARGLIGRKGFPESYDHSKISDFLHSICSGLSYDVPIYCHSSYDLIPGEYHHIHSPDIVILEGINVCQRDKTSFEKMVDHVDFSIYLDAPEHLLKSWYIERFVRLTTEASKEPLSYFNRFNSLSIDEARSVASDRWDQINKVNLVENILPSRDNADLIIEKSADHLIDCLKLKII